MTAEPEEQIPAEDPPRPVVEQMFSRRFLTSITGGAFGLLVIVIAVGLLRDDLDATGVAVILSTLISGILLGQRKGSG